MHGIHLLMPPSPTTWITIESPDPGDTHDFIRFALDETAIVAVTDVTGRITFVNQRFCAISGYSETELIGQNHRMLRSPEHPSEFFRQMYRTIAQGHIWRGEICNRRKDGSLYWVHTTIVPHRDGNAKIDIYIAIRFDITPLKLLQAKLEAREQELRQLIDTDTLTGLFSRVRFNVRLAESLKTRSSDGYAMFLAVVDLDNFKEVNDSLGHDAGDKLLQEEASRLLNVVGDGGFVARLGGDEFAIILNVADCRAAERVLLAALERIREPITIGSSIRRCSASIGVVAVSDGGTTPEGLLKAADIALYHAKAEGRDRLEWFLPSLKEAVDRRAELRQQVSLGLDAGDFVMHYQPIVPLTDSERPSLEALIRWRHPVHGLLSPGYFASALIDPLLQGEIGRFVLSAVFSDLHRNTSILDHVHRVAINVTAADVRLPHHFECFLMLCRQTGIPPHRFAIEVTEGMFLGDDSERIAATLRQWHDAGVEIAMDDFGTGYGSLTHLRSLPVDRVKIDRSFVSNMMASRQDLAIVRAVAALANSLDKSVTAEGVETGEQADTLRLLGCSHLQGWHFAKACSIEKLPVLLDCLQAKQAPPLRRLGQRG